MEQRARMPEGTRLIPWGKGDGDRFARLFRQAWDRLPADARDTLVHAFRSYSAPAAVEFCETSHGLREGPSGDANAQCTRDPDGRLRFTFWSPVFDRLTEASACTLIAHELGHGFLLATTNHHGVDDLVAEVEVDRLLQGWGYAQPDQFALECDIWHVRRALGLVT